MFYPTLRVTNFVALIICCLLLAYAYYLQAQGIEPCPLCMAQRVIFMGMAVVYLITVLHNPKAIGARIYGFIVFLFALLGMAASGRQIWLQYFPHHITEACLPGLQYMLTNLPLSETVRLLFQGTDNCARVDWSLLGLSLAGWAFVIFAVFALLALIQIFRQKINR